MILKIRKIIINCDRKTGEQLHSYLKNTLANTVYLMEIIVSITNSYNALNYTRAKTITVFQILFQFAVDFHLY